MRRLIYEALPYLKWRVKTTKELQINCIFYSDTIVGILTILRRIGSADFRMKKLYRCITSGQGLSDKRLIVHFIL